MAQTSLLLSLPAEEAAAIRKYAAKEDRTISAYVRRIALKQVAVDGKLSKLRDTLVSFDPRLKSSGQRAVLHVRCTSEQAAAIRLAAERRGTSISSYVLY